MGADEERIRREERIRQEIAGAVVRTTPDTSAPAAAAPPEKPASPGAAGDTPPSAPPADPRPGPRSHNRGRLVLLAAVAVVVVTLVLVYILKGGTGDLSGDVFVTMKSGDVKRGADVEITLIPATEQFQSEWKKTVEQFRQGFANAQSSYQQAREASDRAFQRSLDSIRSGFGQSSWASESNQATAAAARVGEVRGRYRAAARKAIAAAQPRIVRTDVNGHYEFKGVPRGKYFVFAAHQVFENDLHWIVPVEVKSGPNRMDLSNSNAGWPFE